MIEGILTPPLVVPAFAPSGVAGPLVIAPPTTVFSMATSGAPATGGGFSLLRFWRGTTSTPVEQREPSPSLDPITLHFRLLDNTIASRLVARSTLVVRNHDEFMAAFEPYLEQLLAAAQNPQGRYEVAVDIDNPRSKFYSISMAAWINGVWKDAPVRSLMARVQNCCDRRAMRVAFHDLAGSSGRLMRRARGDGLQPAVFLRRREWSLLGYVPSIRERLFYDPGNFRIPRGRVLANDEGVGMFEIALSGATKLSYGDWIRDYFSAYAAVFFPQDIMEDSEPDHVMGQLVARGSE